MEKVKKDKKNYATLGGGVSDGWEPGALNYKGGKTFDEILEALIEKAKKEGFRVDIKGFHWVRIAAEEYKKEALSDFMDYLLKSGYCDSDVYCEGNSAIDRFMHPKLRDK